MMLTRPACVTEADSVDLDLHLQLASAALDVPDRAFFAACVACALTLLRDSAELTIRIVDEVEARQLNRRWRERDYATNVLSFAALGLSDIAPDMLGDIVICAPVVIAEAASQGKTSAAHWSHLTVHGVLHLLGFDHADEQSAAIMEEHERVILANLGFADPYRA